MENFLKENKFFDKINEFIIFYIDFKVVSGIFAIL